MASSQLIALEQHLADFEANFIVNRAEFSDYTPQDHMNALGYRLLASAALEHYVEEVCLSAANVGIERMLKSQPTATGRSILLWHLTRKWTRPAAIHEADLLDHYDLIEPAKSAYLKHVRSNHGINGDDLRRLVFPLGLRDAQVPDVLTTSLDVLASQRNPASHTYQNRAKSMTEPAEEVRLIAQILAPLRQLDADLLVATETFPVR